MIKRSMSTESDWIVDHGPYSEFGGLLAWRGAQYIGAGDGIPNIRGLGRTWPPTTPGAQLFGSMARHRAFLPAKA